MNKTKIEITIDNKFDREEKMFINYIMNEINKQMINDTTQGVVTDNDQVVAEWKIY